MLLVYCKKITSRCHYLFSWIFDQWGIQYTATESVQQFIDFQGSKIWYDLNAPADTSAVWIGNEGFLEDKSLREWSIKIFQNGELPAFFRSNGDFNFDIFSAAFYLLSRYEEYLPHKSDQHGRFPATQSLAFRNNFLDIPVVDCWISILRRKLQEKYPELLFQEEHFQTIMTYDVDVSFKYKGRGAKQQMLSAGKDLSALHLHNLFDRVRVLAGFKEDPWDSYAYIQSVLEPGNHAAIFFILCGGRTKYDRNPDMTLIINQKLLRRIRSFARVGLHPSYYSSLNESLIFREKETLENIMQEEVTDSRQHFLKFRIDSTFSALNDAGIQNDYSMGFPDAPGFRAGTSRPFYFYDLRNETPTSLKMFPVCWMDTTFTHYPENSIIDPTQKAKELIEKIRSVKGFFVPIFHNDSFADRYWREVHESIFNLQK